MKTKTVTPSDTKRINGEYYDREEVFKNRKEALTWSKDYRRAKHKARVIKTTRGYTVYVKRREGWEDE